MIVERFWYYAAFVQDGPELVGASCVVVPYAHGRFARIAADDNQLHAFSQMVGECSHLPSVAYFEFQVPGFRAGRSQWSRSCADGTVHFADGKNRLVAHVSGAR